MQCRVAAQPCFCSSFSSSSSSSGRSLPLARILGPPHLDLLATAQTSAMKYLARVTLIFRDMLEMTWMRE